MESTRLLVIAKAFSIQAKKCTLKIATSEQTHVAGPPIITPPSTMPNKLVIKLPRTMFP